MKKWLRTCTIIALITMASVSVMCLSEPEPSSQPIIEIDGGIITHQSAHELIVRCLAPEPTLELEHFSGTVVFMNCFPDARLEGFDGEYQRDGHEILFEVPSSRQSIHLEVPEKATYKFAVLGDSQGMNAVLGRALDAISRDGYQFVIHCGDIVPSGRASEYDAAQAVFNTSSLPIFTTPGNHDIKTDGELEYTARFGPMNYAFEYSGIVFAFIDSSDLTVSEEELAWVRDVYASFSPGAKKVLITHAPFHDPFGDDHTLEPGSCARVEAFVQEEGIDAYFSGHIHAFHRMQLGGTEVIITGGAGGRLTNSNGTHHYVSVTVSNGQVEYEKIDIEISNGNGNDTEPADGSCLAVINTNTNTTVNFTLAELMGFEFVEGDSSFQNQFGNIGGEGHYSGIDLRVLLDLAGGMEENNHFRVEALDGYYQDFGYLNAYPNGTFMDLQGRMILALGCDSEWYPSWQDGPKLVMLPEDGYYSNSDCEQTSYEGQGYHVYPSAGARWVRNVSKIILINTA